MKAAAATCGDTCNSVRWDTERTRGEIRSKEARYYGHVRGHVLPLQEGRARRCHTGVPSRAPLDTKQTRRCRLRTLFGLDRSARSRGHTTTPGDQQKAFGISFFKEVGKASLMVRRLRESTAPQLATEPSHARPSPSSAGRFWVEEEGERGERTGLTGKVRQLDASEHNASHLLRCTVRLGWDGLPMSQKIAILGGLAAGNNETNTHARTHAHTQHITKERDISKPRGAYDDDHDDDASSSSTFYFILFFPFSLSASLSLSFSFMCFIYPV